LLLNQQFLSGITLTLELTSQLPLVTGRRSRMQQILLNLLVNATEAMNGHGRLRIAARATNSPRGEFVLRPGPAARYIELVIEDTGPGIDPQIRDRVHSLAELEKIGISLESAPDRGTSFTLWIPVADVSEELVTEATLTAGGEPRAKARL
jgi:signal transduction histidine kinase